jgi:putative ABC transport system permease protein
MLNRIVPVFWRKFKNDVPHSIGVLTGFSIAIAIIHFAMMYISNEINYDKGNPNYRNLFRVGLKISNERGDHFGTGIPGGWLNVIQNEYPEIELTTKIQQVQLSHSIFAPETKAALTEPNFVWADSNIVQMFSLTKNGVGLTNRLNKSSDVLLSSSLSRKLFGEFDPIGKEIKVRHPWATRNKQILLNVIGIYDDLSENNHFKPKAIASLLALKDAYLEEFDIYVNGNSISSASFSSYLMMKSGTQIDKIVNRLNSLTTYRDIAVDGWLDGSTCSVVLARMDKLHFDKNFEWEIDGQGDLNSLYIISLVCVTILLIASINFIGLSTLRFLKGQKEIGIRKFLGESTSQISFQFIIETIFYTGISYCISIIICVGAITPINNLLHTHFVFADLFNLNFLLFVTSSILFIILMSSIYPAIKLSKIRVGNALKSILTKDRNDERIREGVLGIQFLFSLTLILTCISVYVQLKTATENKIANQGDKILVVSYGGIAPTEKLETIKEEIRRLTGAVATSCNLLPRPNSAFNIEDKLNLPQNYGQIQLTRMDCDPYFIECFNLDIVAGRNFSENKKSIVKEIILNEAALSKSGLTSEQAIDLEVKDMQGTPYLIIGVVKDFPFESIKSKVRAMGMSYSTNDFDLNLYIKLHSSDLLSQINRIRSIWKKTLPEIGFEYSLLTEKFESLYIDELTVMKILVIATFFSLLITLTGLYAISSYWIVQRTKELAIRRILGAGISDIVLTFLRKTSILFVLFSSVSIALFKTVIHDSIYSGYAYRSELSGSSIVMIILAFYLISSILVMLRTIIAIKKPLVETMRYE